MDDDYGEDATMPFIITQMHGGEYDTEAFVSGWHLGILDARLLLADLGGLVIPPMILRTKWKAQADLIAMARGFVLKNTELPEEPGYSVFTFTPSDGDSEI